MSRCSTRSTCGCAPPRSWSPGADAERFAAAALKLPFLDRIVLRAPSAGDLPAAHPAQEKLKAAPGSAAFVCVGETLLAAGDGPAQIADAVAAMQPLTRQTPNILL